MRKMLPCPLVYVDKIEKWLHEMSLKGSHLIKLNMFYAVFENGDSKDISYAVTMHKKVSEADAADNPNSVILSSHKKLQIIDKLDKYNDLGWQLVDCNIKSLSLGIITYPKVYSVYKSTDTTPKCSLHDIFDRAVIAGHTQTIQKTIGFIVILLLLPAELFFITTYEIMKHVPVNDMFFINSARIAAIFIITAIIIYWSAKLYRLYRVYKGKKNTYKVPRKWTLLSSIVIIILMIIILIYNNPEKHTQYIQNASDVNFEPFVNLAVIDGEYPQLMQHENHENYFYGYTNKALFMPLYYEFIEKTMIPAQHGDNLIVQYTKSLLKQPIKYSAANGLKYFKDNNDSEIMFIEGKYFTNIEYMYDYSDVDGSIIHILMLLNTDCELLFIYYKGELTPEEIAGNIEEYFISVNRQ
ncbi:MAG: DUF2812 domain-containing protein [Clostridia bacterium]|nr:DUF2812 domain-containing protein [Clostridia bacterium]